MMIKRFLVQSLGTCDWGGLLKISGWSCPRYDSHHMTCNHVTWLTSNIDIDSNKLQLPYGWDILSIVVILPVYKYNMKACTQGTLPGIVFHNSPNQRTIDDSIPTRVTSIRWLVGYVCVVAVTHQPHRTLLLLTRQGHAVCIARLHWREM
jgi:hypothetical protein